ncbi:hypothetical protein F0U62_23255 [Cystobacter fuscus]|uniref:hypothetical protein n=1 Tax=Cystobacter fuscus TaxID=43 RepID=UPI002B313BA7|nr:hypothetical protein F0U62_23255 [Cystobacter fuscus]
MNIAAGQFAQVDESRRPLSYLHVLCLVDAVIRALRVLGWKPRDTFDPVMAEVVRALPKP